MLLHASLAELRPRGKPMATYVERGEPTANKHRTVKHRFSPNSSVLFGSRAPRCDASCMADARCYAARYPELRALFCADGPSCRVAELLNHFHEHGRKQNRTFHCLKPTPYAENRDRLLRLWTPEGTVPSHAAANKSIVLFRHVEKTEP